MNSKPDSSSTSSQGNQPTSQADEILKQFHPELFHKKKLDAGKGLKQSSPAPAQTQTKAAPKKNIKVAEIHDQGKKSKALNRPSFSLSDMMYTITSGLSDLLEGMANLVPRSFIRAVVNILYRDRPRYPDSLRYLVLLLVHNSTIFHYRLLSQTVR